VSAPRPTTTWTRRLSDTGIARLGLGFALIALLASRLTLVLHEFVGHGGLATAIGCRITTYRLFIFGGGWIRYSRPEPFSLGEAVLVSMGGVSVELLFGTACLLWGRRQSARPLVRLVAVCVGVIDLLHAGYYIVVATHYRFGDGRSLSIALGPWLRVLTVVGTLALLVLAYFLARELMRAAAPFYRASSQSRRIAVVLTAATFAALAHGSLMLVEQRLASDQTYARIMKHQSERRVDAELAKLQARRRAEGREPTRDELHRARETLRRQFRPWPLRPVVIVGLLAAVLLGAYRTKTATQGPPKRPVALGLWVVWAASIALVWALSAP